MRGDGLVSHAPGWRRRASEPAHHDTTVRSLSAVPGAARPATRLRRAHQKLVSG
ncbi:hypothetical protein N177_1270 [Lutibaculum baratangense AMV1]|uniref:Uncharacterized protein n=1 Tax=Lutibaculum baratangense AMV1 TaxID=631454 RepID=V4RS37_9HYPH|nr:hypothetical protein N177_1270 [Lutibaculum baratangense AMV1]